MTHQDEFEKAAIALEERIKVIEEISEQYNEKKAFELGIKFRNWIFNNIPDDLQQGAMNWRSLYPDERKKVARGFVYFLSGYKQIKIKSVHFKKTDTQDSDVISECGDKTFVFYDKFLNTDNFNEVIGYLAHEITHFFQDAFQTSLSHDVASKGQLYYVEPIEDEVSYKYNPREKEANVIEDVVNYSFCEQIMKNNFIETFNYKN